MSKKLILDVLKKTRSSSKIINKQEELKSESENDNDSITSKYFDIKRKRKRNSVKIQSDTKTIDEETKSKINEINTESNPHEHNAVDDKIKKRKSIQSENESNTETINNVINKGTNSSINEVNTESKPETCETINNKIKNPIETVVNPNKWMPQNWEVMLENIRKMRSNETAPVDSMGCHKCSDPNADPRISRYQSLIALMLSSQTKDQVTHAAMQRLNTYGCTPEIIMNTPDDVLEQLIYPVGFRKKKVQYIKKASKILIEEYKSDIPRTLEDLCKLPGVGPKMGHICMRIAWNEVSGIGVDTHVHRICNRISWVRKRTKTPEETRMDLEEWLPKHLWCDVNHLLVGFGQEICLPRFPKCESCLNKDICPSSTIKNKK
ncbi:endonuclease III-like protein 1 [Ceratina calcarata]|uniref:Endonuclease III homolog n=1 Tax=Ceratina calcarata TaxID=156304 RepID=A0AAJ7N637_9HYME|nr:endonuclease III-like protein 1 [Ceratina calcarata]